MKFSVRVVSPPNYAHSHTFDEVATGLIEGLQELNLYHVEGRPIILGANTCHDLPDNAIIFNLEQGDSGWMTPAYVHLMQTHETWTYDELGKLKQRGVNARYCGIGYAKALQKIKPAHEDIDVLFYGSIFGRRMPILESIKATGLRCEWLFGVYGEERDAYIARSKIILNLHAYQDDGPFEIVRCSHLLANKKFILSEPSVPARLEKGIAVARPDNFPERCLHYIKDEAARRGIAARGYELFAARKQSEYLKTVTERPLLPLDLLHPSRPSDLWHQLPLFAP